MGNIIEHEGLSVAEACTIAGIGRTKLYEAIADLLNQDPANKIT